MNTKNKKMKLKAFFALSLLVTSLTMAQVGVGTLVPDATLDVIGKPTDVAVADGIIAPRISRAQLIAKTAYAASQTGTIIYVSDLSGTLNAATTNITSIGYYYFNGSLWLSMNGGNAMFTFGDIKTGIQSADHNGWIKLDGRAKSSLTGTQQTEATTLGIGANLPDATDAFLVQNGSALGSVTNSNLKTISQANLPNVNFTGSINDVAHGNSIASTASGVFTRVVGSSNGNATSGGDTETFNMSIPLNGGVTQTNLDITPQSLSVNTFIYLGN